MNTFTNNPDAIALVKQIRETIAIEGVLYICNPEKSNIQSLLDIGISSAIRNEIIKALDINDYIGCPQETYSYPYRAIAAFEKKYKQHHYGIKISLGVLCTPAVCLQFCLVPQTVYRI